MRAPFQILAIPYKKDCELLYCVLHRFDIDQWQFVAGGGEDNETPKEAVIREIYEEALKRLTWDSNKTALYELNCRLLEA